jgi:hypothetical protein
MSYLKVANEYRFIFIIKMLQNLSITHAKNYFFTGREGLTAEQVLRRCILKQYRQLSYEELAFHLDYSSAFRTFSRLEMGQISPQIDSPREHQVPVGRDLGGYPFQNLLERHMEQFGRAPMGVLFLGRTLPLPRGVKSRTPSLPRSEGLR